MHRIGLRYRETLLGFGWIFLQPVCLTFVFNYIQRIANFPTGNIPYPLFAATGLVAWAFTSLVANQSTVALLSYGGILKRVYLPKWVLPLSVPLAALADLGVMALLFVGLMAYYRFIPPATCLWLPLIFLVHLALLIGMGYLLALTNVFVRDMAQAIPHLFWLWFFASPIFYPASKVPIEFRPWARWNPLTGIVEGYRSVLLMGQPPSPELFLPACLVSFSILLLGWICFRRLQGIVVDLL
jgi:ABC-type polysaccharide/polyol phosphate export permease